MYQVALIEDDDQYARQIQEYILRCGETDHQQFRIKLFCDGEAFLFRSSWEFDMVIIDIELPGMNGMEVARRIRKDNEYIGIMFITSLAEYAIQGYAVRALDYVLKPLTYDAFRLRLLQALGRVDKQRNASIVLVMEEKQIKIEVRNIQYVEIQNKILTYHTLVGGYSLRGTLRQAEEQLLKFHFVKGNYWYIANLAHVEAIGSKTMTVGEMELPMSRGNREKVLEAFHHYLGGGDGL